MGNTLIATNPTARGRMVYTFGLKHKTTDDMTGAAQGGQAGPTPFFYFDYSENDMRRDITYRFHIYGIKETSCKFHQYLVLRQTPLRMDGS